MSITIQGLSAMRELADALDVAGHDITDSDAEPVFNAIEREYRRVKFKIPKDTGALMKSLTRRGDRHHVEGVIGGRITYGSDLPQAVYQFHRIPVPSGSRLSHAVASMLFRKLRTL